MADELAKAREYLREKNEIIKAFAGPTGMTPEDVAYLRDEDALLQAAVKEFAEAQEQVRVASAAWPPPGVMQEEEWAALTAGDDAAQERLWAASRRLEALAGAKQVVAP